MIRSAAASAAAVPMLPGGEYHGTTPSKRAARGRDSAPCTPSQAPGWCHARNNTFGAEEARAKIDVFFFFAENFENSEPTDFTENAVSPLLLRARAQLGRIPNV